jgi:hypothetical protein
MERMRGRWMFAQIQPEGRHWTEAPSNTNVSLPVRYMRPGT